MYRETKEKPSPNIVKGPVPPPRDYPTIDLKNPGAMGRCHGSDVYDVIKEPKKKNSYVQNDIMSGNPPPLPKTGTGSRSLNGSVMGKANRPDFHSLDRSLTGAGANRVGMGTQRSGGSRAGGSVASRAGSAASSHSGSYTSSRRRSSGVVSTPMSQRLNKAMASKSVSSSHNSNWSIASQNSQSLTRSNRGGGGSHSRRPSYTANSISRSVASAGSASPLTSRYINIQEGINNPEFPRAASLQSVYSNIDDDTTYQEPIVKTKVDWTNGSISRSMTSGSESDNGRPSAQSLNRRMAASAATSGSPISTRSVTHSNFTRTQSMYGNLPRIPFGDPPPVPINSHGGSLDGMNHMYMNSIKRKQHKGPDTKPRPPHRARSSDISSLGRNQQQSRKPRVRNLSGSSTPQPSSSHRSRRLGPQLHINTAQKLPKFSSRRHRPPGSPFGDDHQELTTPL